MLEEPPFPPAFPEPPLHPPPSTGITKSGDTSPPMFSHDAKSAPARDAPSVATKIAAANEKDFAVFPKRVLFNRRTFVPILILSARFRQKRRIFRQTIARVFCAFGFYCNTQMGKSLGICAGLRKGEWVAPRNQQTQVCGKIPQNSSEFFAETAKKRTNKAMI